MKAYIDDEGTLVVDAEKPRVLNYQFLIRQKERKF